MERVLLPQRRHLRLIDRQQREHAVLAQQMVELSGLKVRTPDQDGDIEIVFTGLRPGEKLYEELLIGNEPAPTVHPRILMANENFLPLATLDPALEELERACRAQSREKVWAILERLVPEYAPSNQIVDWTHIKG